jgi:tetratricopeptide (TPR) repeat protein
VTELFQTLAASLAPAYRLERELGGGGMSRVFLAEEPRLGRRVVVKVLPPETSAGIPADRFEREVRLAASLQHPHLVPVLAAGAAEGLVYYVMPYIEGESLAARLAREGALPVGEAVRLLRDVTDALAYAHARGVVHRDVKPDNILLSGRHALVTDFGVAKAVSAAVAEGGGPGPTLTSAGLALGTPAYMAPEQAAADPHLDHRADIYALGAVAYEMLAGRAPFTAPTPQAMLAAHVAVMPDPVDRHRAGIPPELAALVMRCLEKHPADRWQSADALLERLESGSDTVTPLPGARATPRTEAVPAAGKGVRHTGRTLALFALATGAVTGVAFALSRVAGLPDWVWIAALGCMAAGLGVMLLTGRVERRRALLGAAGALGALALLTGGYAASRELGIGPAATLLSAGTLETTDRLVLADFADRTGDSTLGDAVTEALRVDLGQSRVVRLLDGRQVAGALQRIGARPDTALGEALAREVAVREGAKAVVAGEIARLGTGYVLTARVIAADSGATLAPVRVTAEDDARLIPAVNRLSAELRERIGESLRTIRASEPLERVTTASLPALRLYTEGSRAFTAGDYPAARGYLERATRADTAFATAWRKLAAAYFNTGANRSLRLDAARRAFRHRDRLPPLERHLTEAYYYSEADHRPAEAIAAYRAALEIAPEDVVAINNLGLVLNREGRFAEAELVLARGLGARGPMTMATNLAYALLSQAKWSGVDSLLRVVDERAPAGHNAPVSIRLDAAMARRDYARAESLAAAHGARPGGALPPMAVVFTRLALDEMHGRLRRVERSVPELLDSALARGDRQMAADGALVPAFYEVARGRPESARALLRQALAGPAYRGLPDADLPFSSLAQLHARLGDPDGVRRIRRTYEVVRPPEAREPSDLWWWEAVEAEAERRWRDAASAYARFAAMEHCSPCGVFYAAHMWDRAGVADSAVHYYRLGVERPVTANNPEDSELYALALRRLGALAEERGDRRAALDWYGRFTDLRRDADPELQPEVRAVRERVAALAAEPRPREASAIP